MEPEVIRISSGVQVIPAWLLSLAARKSRNGL